MTDIHISDPLMQVIFSAVEEGLSVLQAEQDVVPFVLLLTKEGVIIKRFTDERLSEAIQRAIQAIETADDDTLGYALVYDGQIEIGNQDSDALMIEAGERGKVRGWRFVQRYQAKIGTQSAHLIGNIAYLGEYDNHIS